MGVEQTIEEMRARGELSQESAGYGDLENDDDSTGDDGSSGPGRSSQDRGGSDQSE